MKTRSVSLIGMVWFCLFLTLSANADPRMETNKNFCHFILDPDNTDNEVFAAGCDSVITVVEKPVSADKGKIACEEYVASGYGTLTRILPPTAIPLPPGTQITFTSKDSNTPCTMVESNGRAYKSYKWQSTIKVDNLKKGLVKVTYELLCELDLEQ